MAQEKILSWTNPATAVLRNLNFGFTVAEIKTIDVTNGVAWYWNSSMPSGSFQRIDSGAITLSNGFIPLAQGGIFAAPISGFTNANPGVITATELRELGFAAGDKVSVGALADDETGTGSLNGSYTIASVNLATNGVTLVESTVGKAVYVSGGALNRVQALDVNGVLQPVPNKNVAIQGVSAGTGSVGANNASMVAIASGDNPVV